MQQKSSPEEIRERFDADVERFSNLDTGQSAAIDASLVLDLIANAARASNPGARRSLDVGSGAGNFTLKLLEVLPELAVDLVDLSQPMLERFAQRLSSVARGEVRTFQADIRELEMEAGGYDII